MNRNRCTHPKASSYTVTQDDGSSYVRCACGFIRSFRPAEHSREIDVVREICQE